MKLSNIQDFINAAESLADEYNFNLSESIVTFGPDSLTVSFPDGTCTVEITYSENERRPNE